MAYQYKVLRDARTHRYDSSKYGVLDLMESPPPVPPKDTPKSSNMDITASGSKRKRDAADDTIYERRNGRLEPIDPDAATPQKRSRQSDTEASTETSPQGPRGVRRKKKVGNLSNLNLRHAAEQQRIEKERANEKARESRFQEGSLTDKPSEKPPSAFTRMIRTDSGNIKQIDELMEGYNDNLADGSVEMDVHREQVALPQRVNEIAAAQQEKREEEGGFFRFGRSFASNFHPVALWNKLWNETREDLIRQNVEEAERKRRQKEEAEAKYAEMKAAGQLARKPVGNFHADVDAGISAIPRDSAIAIDSARPSTSTDHKRNASNGSTLMPPPTIKIQDDVSSHSGSDFPEAAGKASKGTFRSRFSFKRPSMSNLKDGLKRVKSDFNLAAAASANRDSSSSLSPVKQDFDAPATKPPSTLHRSASKFDLKKQHKLSKRVSDLETKLALARRELDEALVEASPAPKLGNKYQRFTPQSTIKRPSFVPGRLPSLPSERLLQPEQLGFGDDEASPEKSMASEPRKAFDLSEAMDIDGDETIKITRDQHYPTRASSLFKLSNDNIEALPSPTEEIANNHTQDGAEDNIETAQPTTDQLTADMDTSSLTQFTSEGAPAPTEPTNGDNSYLALDAKLKALDKNMKVAKKAAAKGKKRKSGETDRIFKPGTDDDDDAEWEAATPKKKRKSAGGKGEAPTGSPQQVKKKGSQTGGKIGAKGKKVAVMSDDKDGEAEMEDAGAQLQSDAAAGAEETAEAEDVVEDLPTRRSMDSQGQPLEPVFEEEEELENGTTIEKTTVTIPLNDEPSRPTAKATPARHSRRTGRSRSPEKCGTEETMFTRAAEAAQGRRGGRSVSPSHGNIQGPKFMLINGEMVLEDEEDAVVERTEMEAVVEKSALDKNANGEKFEWPEDVF